MNTLIVIIGIVNLLVLSFGIVLIIRKNKVKESRMIEALIDKLSLDHFTEITDCFSKDVINLYLDIVKNPNKYSIGICVLNVPNSDINIWSANEVSNRRFYTHNSDKEEEVEKMNSKLTKYDKILLDKIIKAFEKRESLLLTKFFI